MHDFHVRKIWKDFPKKVALRFCLERTAGLFLGSWGLFSLLSISVTISWFINTPGQFTPHSYVFLVAQMSNSLFYALNDEVLVGRDLAGTSYNCITQQKKSWMSLENAQNAGQRHNHWVCLSSGHSTGSPGQGGACRGQS